MGRVNEPLSNSTQLHCACGPAQGMGPLPLLFAGSPFAILNTSQLLRT